MRKEIYRGLDDSFHQQEIVLYQRDPSKACFLAYLTDQEEPVGFIETSLRNVVDGCLSSPVGYIEGIYVAPRFRGKGIGAALVQKAIAWFQEQSCSEMATDALADDQLAQSFHRRMGFQETYRIVQFKRMIQKDEETA